MMRVVILLALMTISMPARADSDQPTSKLDPYGNIGYDFDNGFSIRFGQRSDDPVASACSAAYEGVIRYNTAIKSIEFCDGTVWRNMIQKPEVKIDYSTCKDAVSMTSFAHLGGPVSAGNTELICGSADYIVVATDALSNTTSDTMVSAYCCKMKLVDPSFPASE